MKRDRRHLARVAAIGCIVCRNEGHGTTPPEYTAIHHIRHQAGMGRRAPDTDAIPLCAAHHQTGGHGVAFHAGKEAFEARHGTELELLAQVRKLLNEAP